MARSPGSKTNRSPSTVHLVTLRRANAPAAAALNPQQTPTTRTMRSAEGRLSDRVQSASDSPVAAAMMMAGCENHMTEAPTMPSITAR